MVCHVRLPREDEKKIMETVYIAGGCLWGVQHFFDKVPGVLATEAGRANGTTNTLDILLIRIMISILKQMKHIENGWKNWLKLKEKVSRLL